MAGYDILQRRLTGVVAVLLLATVPPGCEGRRALVESTSEPYRQLPESSELGNCTNIVLYRQTRTQISNCGSAGQIVGTCSSTRMEKIDVRKRSDATKYTLNYGEGDDVFTGLVNSWVLDCCAILWSAGRSSEPQYNRYFRTCPQPFSNGTTNSTAPQCQCHNHRCLNADGTPTPAMGTFKQECVNYNTATNFQNATDCSVAFCRKLVDDTAIRDDNARTITSISPSGSPAVKTSGAGLGKRALTVNQLIMSLALLVVALHFF